MSATAPISADESADESIDDRIARLKAELADAELDKVGDELGTVAGNFVMLVPECWEAGEEHPLDELRAALGFVREAWKRFEVWRTARGASEARTATTRPYLALPPVPPPAPLENGKRPNGSGSVQSTGNGFQWRLSRDGKVTRGRTWPTRDEAEAELARVVSDPEFVPAPKDRVRLAGTSRHHCSRCQAGGHRAPSCPQGAQGTQEQPEAAGGAGGPATPTRARDARSGCFTPGTPPPPTVDEAAPAKRPDGAGTIIPNGPGWRWQVQRGGEKTSGTTYPTRELAELSLAEFLATEAAPAELGKTRSKCGKCQGHGHNARTCPATAGPAEPGPADDDDDLPLDEAALGDDAVDDDLPPAEDEPPPPAPPAKPIPPPVVTAKAAPAPAVPPCAPPPSSSSRYIHPGRGWGPVDAGGFANHEPCKGTGRVEHNDGKGKVTRVRCIPCAGEGSKACIAKRSAVAERRTP